MPFHWTVERERQMLLLIIQSLNVRPSAEHWSAVAAQLGGGLTQSAVSQKYYKLRNGETKGSSSQPKSASTTPTKRKAADDDDVKPTPSKRARPVLKEEQSDQGTLVGSSEVSFKSQLKAELAAVPTNYVQQQELWDPFQYREELGNGDSDHMIRWVEGVQQGRKF